MKYLIIKPEEYQQAINECERLAKENEELKTSLDHAAEVLAKEIHRRKGVTYKDIPLSKNDYSFGVTSGTAMYFTRWEILPDEERQQYINEAMEMLK